MSLIMEIVTTTDSGMAVSTLPFSCPMPGTSYRRTKKRKYAFASLEN